MSPMPSEEVVVARSAFGQAWSSVLISSALASSSSTIASTTTSQSARSLGSVVTRRREGSAPSILAQAATTCSSARQAEASDRASRIVSAVVVETAARPVAMAPLPAIPGLSYPCLSLIGRVPISSFPANAVRLTDPSIEVYKQGTGEAATLRRRLVTQSRRFPLHQRKLALALLAVLALAALVAGCGGGGSSSSSD